MISATLTVTLIVIALVSIGQVAGQSTGVQEILPETRVTTCGCFSGVTSGRDIVYCGTNCGIAGCPAQTPCPRAVFGDPIDTEVRWGESVTMGQPNFKSGMGFTGEVNKLVPLNAEFFVGRLTHFNHPIIGPAKSTDLTIQLRIPDFNVNQNFKFTLQIDETPNNENNGPCAYPSTTPCADKITFDLAGFDFSKKFTVGGAIEYTLRLTGFKETRVSQSRSTSQFISNEKRENNAFLFAEVVAACPDTCLSGGSPEILTAPDGRKYCGCVCPAGAATACQRPLELQADCGCECPLVKCNGYKGDKNNNCACLCPTPMAGMACMAPKTEWDAQKCQCKCPANVCGQGFLADLEKCTCACDGVQCPNGATPDPNNGCQCRCELDCGPDQLEDLANCKCVCDPAKNTCGTGFTWELDPNNLKTCKCGCANQCGTGCTAVGAVKECTDGPQQQCCKNCKITPDAPCDDKNMCTVNDRCQGDPAMCKGDPKCPQPLDTCTQVQCNPTTGECTESAMPDGSACGTVGTLPADFDKCKFWCEGGLCVRKPPIDCSLTEAEKTQLGELGQCSGKFCNPRTGECTLGVENNKPCNDNNLCTYDDKCDQAGQCKGTPNLCDGADGILPPPKECHVYECDRLLGECLPQPAPFDSPCGDDSDKCATPGKCSGGVCLKGRKCPRLQGDDAQCATMECDAATGACIKQPRPLGSPCILASGFARNEDFCGSNYTCTALGECTRGYTHPDRANHSLCAPLAVGSDFGKNVPAIVGGAVGGTLLVMIIAAVILAMFVKKQALLDPSTWQTGADVGLEQNPLYEDNGAAVQNQLYAG